MAISIPIFTSQLEKSREATDLANIRSGYAEAMTTYMTDNVKEASATGKVIQQVNGWTTSSHVLKTRVNGTESDVEVGSLTSGGSWEVKIAEDANGSVTVTAGPAGG